jgi:MFS family permease
VIVRSVRAWWIWLLAVAFVVYLFSVQTAYSIVSPRIQEDLGLDVREVGRIAALYTWVFAVFQFFSGALLDRLGSGKVLPVAIGLVTIGVFVFANADSYAMSLLAQGILALGACCGFVGAGYIGGQWFGMAKFSFMFGLVQFAASVASAFNQNVIGVALGHATWRELFTIAGGFGVLLTLLGALFIRNPGPVEGGIAGGIGRFVGDVVRDVLRVARIAHVWAASIFGALSFGAVLSLGVVWGPKLLAARGFDPDGANRAASLIWLGLAAGCLVVPRWSDASARRKLPIAVTLAVQVAALAMLLYVPSLGGGMSTALCFAFGFGGAAHMLAFSTAADVVAARHIGTSAALVNGLMFLVGGVMIARPGVRTGWALERGLGVGTLDVAQFAAWPLVAALAGAWVLAALMDETYPAARMTHAASNAGAPTADPARR